MKSSRTMVVNGGSEMDALFLLRRQQELLTQLRALILPALRDADGRSADLAIGLFDDVIDCITGVVSRLQGFSSQAGGDRPPTAFDLAGVDVISPNAGEGQEEKPMISNVGQKRRSYYRCAYTEQNCPATKTIQQQDHNVTINCEEETAKYIVVYYGHHTCCDGNTRNGAKNDPGMDLIQNGKMAGTVTEFQKFDPGDVDMPALIEVLDNPELNWDII